MGLPDQGETTGPQPGFNEAGQVQATGGSTWAMGPVAEGHLVVGPEPAWLLGVRQYGPGDSR